MSALHGVRIPAEALALQPLVEQGIVGPVETHFAGWVARAGKVDDPLVLLGAAMAAWAVQRGHTCLDLTRTATAVSDDQARRAEDTDADEAGLIDVARTEFAWPDTGWWCAALAEATEVVRVVTSHDVGDEEFDQPLVLWGQRLFLQRHWLDECRIATSLRTRAAHPIHPLSPTAVALLDRVLPEFDDDGTPNLQRVAAMTALTSQVAVVVGGPGTGKTSSVARLLAVMIEDAQARGTSVRIALTAPTGKASARLQETIATAQTTLAELVSDSVAEQLGSLEGTTIHRLLGSFPNARQRFRHDAGNPLPHNVVVIDEVSMVSLPMLARLLEALRPDTRVVMLGDPDQLESVELGAVLADMVRASGVDRPGSESHAGPLADRAVRLLRNYRNDLEIADIADAVRSHSPDATVACLGTWDGALPDGGVRFVAIDDLRDGAAISAVRDVLQPTLLLVREAALDGRETEALAAMSAVRVLCAHRRGPAGVSEWNRLSAGWMHNGDPPDAQWYPGRPVMVTRNVRRLGLANGDTGVVVQTPDGLKAVFARSGGPERFDPVELDDVDTAFALTIHKSQGSEYPTVVMILPPASSPLATRELLYTGITRARSGLLVVGSEAAVRQCVLTSSQRMTGLADALA